MNREYYYMIAPYTDELYHYGVLGMKWGVHRNLSNLSKAHSGDSVNKKQHNKAVSNLRYHRNQINKKITKLNTKSERLANKEHKSLIKMEPKRAKLQKRAAKYNVKADKARSYKKSRQLRLKANKLNYKASKLANKTVKIEAKIAKNERLKKLYATNLGRINKEMTKKGYDFIYD